MLQDSYKRASSPPVNSLKSNLSLSFHNSHRSLTVYQKFQKALFYQKVGFSMNRLSIFSLVFGLMFLGTTFFLAGFLVGVSIQPHQNIPPYHSAPSSRYHLPENNPYISEVHKHHLPSLEISPQYAIINGINAPQFSSKARMRHQSSSASPHPYSAYYSNKRR